MAYLGNTIINGNLKVVNGISVSGNLIGNVTGNCSGTAANVTGTVAIAHGGTGATTRLAALQALTNENVSTSAQYFLTITSSWGKGGYTAVADAKTVLGLKSAAYTESSAYAAKSHGNHVPTTQTANNAIFLRNDNTWQTVTPANIGAAASSHTHSYLPLSGGTLTGSLTLQGNGLNITHKQTAWTRGTAPSANAAIWMYRVIDSAGKDMGGLYKWIGTDKSSKLYLYNYTHANNTGGAGGLAVCHDASGNLYTEAPTPGTADSSTKIATTAYVKANVPKSIGSATKPVYTNANGVITACTYTLEKSVPSNAVFTDNNTTNTAGSTNTTSKIFLIGATSQAASPVTYSNSACYVTNGAFYSTTISTGGNITMGGTSGTSYIQLPSGIKLY